jgi:Arc/MetJ-type ribon-helix-helix transcriptional regulator
MTTISVPITSEQEKFINDLVKSGKAANKAHAVRYAIQRLSEEEAIASIERGLADIRAGRVYYGDPRKLVKKFRA